MTKIRAVTYNRCSTEEESQADALKKQIEESVFCIQNNGWMLTDKYVEAKSGTSTKGRSEYNRLYADLLTDKFDVVVIKSQDRLMRNVKDWYLFIDRLVSSGKKLFIYLEHKFYTTDDALITGIKAILAEDYSRELSKKINNAHRHRQKDGKSFVLTSQTFGYLKNTDGTITVNETEAPMIRKIFELSAAGYGCRYIANTTAQSGFVNRRGKRISEGTIRRIIRNELFSGTPVMNRVHFNFETKTVIKNPKSEWIFVEGGVPAIVSPELWFQANAAMDARAIRKPSGGGGGKGSNPGKFQLSQKLVCGLCGARYYRVCRPKKADKEQTVDWKCSTYINHGRKTRLASRQSNRKIKHSSVSGCDNIHLEEEKLFSLLEDICNQYYQGVQANQDSIIKQTITILHQVLSENPVVNDVEKQISSKNRLLRQKDMLLDKLLEKIISDDDYKRKVKELDYKLTVVAAEIERLEEQQEQLHNIEDRIAQVRKRLREGGFNKANIYEMIENIDSILVYPEELIINFSQDKLLGLDTLNLPILESDSFESPFSLKVPIVHVFRKDLVLERMRETVVGYMEAEPQITARIIADRLNVSLSTVNKRIAELKAVGRIRFIGAGGHGYWHIDPVADSRQSGNRET